MRDRVCRRRAPLGPAGCRAGWPRCRTAPGWHRRPCPGRTASPAQRYHSWGVDSMASFTIIHITVPQRFPERCHLLAETWDAPAYTEHAVEADAFRAVPGD